MKHISHYLGQSPLVQEAARRDREERERDLEEQRLEAEAIRNRQRRRAHRTKQLEHTK